MFKNFAKNVKTHVKIGLILKKKNTRWKLKILFHMKQITVSSVSGNVIVNSNKEQEYRLKKLEDESESVNKITKKNNDIECGCGNTRYGK